MNTGRALGAAQAQCADTCFVLCPKLCAGDSTMQAPSLERPRHSGNDSILLLHTAPFTSHSVYLLVPGVHARCSESNAHHRPKVSSLQGLKERKSGSTRDLRPLEQLERPAGFPSSDKTRPDSPGEPGMQPRDPCLPWRGKLGPGHTLRCHGGLCMAVWDHPAPQGPRDCCWLLHCQGSGSRNF